MCKLPFIYVSCAAHSNLWTHYVNYHCLEIFFKSSWYLKDVKWNNLRKKIHKIYYSSQITYPLANIKT